MKLNELLMPLKFGTYIKIIHKDQIIYNDEFDPMWFDNRIIMNLLNAEVNKIYIDDFETKIISSTEIFVNAQKLVIEIKELEENNETTM